MSFSPYNTYYKTELLVSEPWRFKPWDVFISAFNSSDRVREVYSKAPAVSKYWLIHSEYGYSAEELPKGKHFIYGSDSEAEFIQTLVAHVEQDERRDISSLSICIDITGFMRPHLIFLALYLKSRGVKKYDVLYSEPTFYSKKEQTIWAEGTILVRQIEGY